MSFWMGESGKKDEKNVEVGSQRGKVCQVYVALKKKELLIISVSVLCDGC